MDDGEIEYLDEDEDLVQQYVQTAPTLPTPVIESVATLASDDIEELITPLLVERKRPRKVKTEDDDSDYDPTEDIQELIAQRNKKRKVHKKVQSRFEYTKRQPITQPLTTPIRNTITQPTQQNVQNLNKKYEIKLQSLPNLTVQKKQVPEKYSTVQKVVQKQVSLKDSTVQKVVQKLVSLKDSTVQKVVPKQVSLKDSTVQKVVQKMKVSEKKDLTKYVNKFDNINERKKLDIRIPDYEDPICLPVRAIKRDNYDSKKLQMWNNLCLEHYRKADTTLKPDNWEAVRSIRTVVLRNMKNKYTGKIDTSVCGKVTVINSSGNRKSETYQGTLPKYREKKVLNSYPLEIGSQRSTKHIYEAILTKEEHKGEETLVIYKPREAVSAVYKCIENNQEETEDSILQGKRVVKEVTCCKVCAPCYQASWRGIRKQNKTEHLVCSVCKRTFVSVYNLLTHLNTNHTAIEVAGFKKDLSKTLAKMVEYHYRCRICQQQFPSIKLLRKHIPRHQGMELFKCEIGNHMAS